MVILHSGVGGTQVLKVMGEDRTEVTPERLEGLASIRNHHINRFGDYTMDK